MAMMRKLVACLVLLIFLLSESSFCVHALSTNEYKLDELDLSVSLPSEYIVFTRQINEDDPNLAAYGLTKESMSSLMTSGHMYLNAWKAGAKFEVVITMISSSQNDFNQLSNSTLSTLATTLKATYESIGKTYLKSEIYQQSQVKFLKIYNSQPNGDAKIYGLQYSTVYAGKAINVTLNSFSGPITSEDETALKSIVDSVKFKTYPQYTENVFLSTNAFTYEDEDTKASFTVPANWSETPLSKARETLDVKFTSNIDKGMAILYGSTDVWSTMTDSERKGRSRSEINNSALTEADIDELSESTGAQVDNITFNGHDYYRSVSTHNYESNGAEIAFKMTHLLYNNNGYMHLFQFSGTSESPLYADFVSLMESVRYPEVDVIKSGNSVNKRGSSSVRNPYSIENLLLSLLITLTIYSLPIIIYRYAVRKSPIAPKTAKRITIIYGIVAFAVMNVLMTLLYGNFRAGTAIVLWSYINYKMLTAGGNRYVKATNRKDSDSAKVDVQTNELQMVASAAESTVPQVNVGASNVDVGVLSENSTTSAKFRDEKEIIYCHKCGNSLQPGSSFCNKCGVKVTKTSGENRS